MTGRVVVITGGTAGIGRATARLFTSRGDSVAVIARGEDGLAATRAELERAGVALWTGSIDVADADQLERAATAIEDALGPIDVWVNNATDPGRRSAERSGIGSDHAEPRERSRIGVGGS